MPYGNWGIYNASTWDNYFAGNIGIGNSSPGSNKLLVAGSTVIGIGYTGVTAPTNGLAVQGNVGIGSTGRAGFVLDVGGNVNIGTGATVGSSLTVLGTSNLAGTTASQFYSSGSITGGTSLTIVGNSNLAGTTVNQLYNSNVSTLAGNVGIGTTGGAGYKLYVAGAIYGTTLVQNGNTVCDSSGNCGGGVTGGATNYLARWISATQLSTGVSYDNGSFVGIGYTAGTGAALLVNGNVGIGVTNPGNKLTVLTGFSVASAANSNYVTTAAPSGGAIIEGLTGIGTTSPKNRLDVAGAVAIGALPSVALPQANMLYVSGNVGIGNSNPTYQLEVSGKSRFGGTLAASHTVDIVASGSDTPLAIQGGNSVIEFWKDTTPTKAMSLGLAVPGGTVGEDFIFSAYNGSSWGEKVRFTGSGNVGIGFSAPASKLTVAGNLSVGAGYSGVAAPTNGLLVEGNVGLGTTNPSALLSLVSVGSTAPTGGLFSLDWSPLTASTFSSDLFSINIGYSGTALTLFSIKDNGSSLFSVSEAIVDSNLPAAFNASGDVAVAYDINFTNPTASYIKSNAPLSIQSGEVFNSSDLTLRTYNAGNIVFDLGTTGKIVTPGSNDLLISPGGGVGIGSTDPGSNTLKVVGSLCVKSNDGNCAGSTAGTIYATTTTISSADYAENYVSGQELEPGDVVVGETGGNDQAVVRAERENDKNILGIVSTSPGVLLNSDVATDSAHPKAYPIALSGRVPLKVSTLNGPIKEGDFLTSSSVPGVAVKAIKAGAVVAKALSPFQSNELREVGTIMSFVHIGWYDPDVYISETGDYSVKRETVNGLTIYRTRTSANAVIQRNGIFNSLVASYITVGQLKAEDILVNGVSLTDTLNTLSAKTASQSAQLVDLAARVTSLEGGGTSQENVLAASDSADLQTLLSRVEFLEASLFNSVSSASGAFEASESAIFDKKVIADALTVIGHTNLNSLAVTATFSAGLVRIDGYDTSEATPAASINSVVGPLRLQSFALEGLEFVGGKVKMSRKGDITLTDGKIIGNKQFADKTVIKEGQLEGRVDREWEIPPSGIILTPSYNTRAWVEDISPTGFVIRVDSTPTSDREIYWMATWNE